MQRQKTDRRKFLQIVTATTLLHAIGNMESAATANVKGVRWPVGCFNRPWTKWSYDVALDGLRDAGFKLTGLLTRTKEEPFIGSGATPEYLEKLKQRIAARGLTANMGALHTKHDIPVEDSIRDVRRQIDNAKYLSLTYLLTFGIEQPDQYDRYYRVMADAARYAADQGLRLVMKPHGGSSGAAEEMLRSLERVNHPNFKIWYDAGNVIYYTGKDPVEELKPVAQYITGFCAKDCAEQKSEVMIQFGTGKVNFKSVLNALKTAGFNGPIMIECCALGPTPEEVTRNARANREYLERILGAI